MADLDRRLKPEIKFQKLYYLKNLTKLLKKWYLAFIRELETDLS